jgi:hypothetical protein
MSTPGPEIKVSRGQAAAIGLIALGLAIVTGLCCLGAFVIL